MPNDEEFGSDKPENTNDNQNTENTNTNNDNNTTGSNDGDGVLVGSGNGVEEGDENDDDGEVITGDISGGSMIDGDENDDDGEVITGSGGSMINGDENDEEGEPEMSIPNTYGTGAGKPGSIGGQVTTGYTVNNSAPAENKFLEPKLPAGTVWKNGEEKLHPTNLDHTNTPMPAQAFLAAKERGRICAQKQVKFLNKQYQTTKDYIPR